MLTTDNKVTKAIWYSAAFRHIFQNTGSAKHVGILVSFSWMCLNGQRYDSVGGNGFQAVMARVFASACQIALFLSYRLLTWFSLRFTDFDWF